MQRIYLTIILLGLLAISMQAQTAAPATSPGPVSRITFYEIKAGKGADYTKFRREHSKPILDELKKQGLILDYKWFTQPTGDGPNNWDVALVVVFKTYADALENPENGRKLDEISLKHYGSQESRDKADAFQRELRDVVSSHLMREQILNPIN